MSIVFTANYQDVGERS